MAALLKQLSLLFTLVVAFAMGNANAQTPAAPSKPPSVTNAFVYVPLGASKDTQLFFTFKNNSQDPLVITSIQSSQVARIEWVPAAVREPLSPSNPWLIQAGQTLVLEPKHNYFQLKGLKASLTTGDEMIFELGLSDGKKIQLIARARSAYDQIHGH